MRLILMALFCFNSMALKLSTVELNKIQQEKFLTEVKKLEGKVWPEVIIKAYIDAKPLESAAIFSGFEYQKNYIPNLLVSKIVKKPKNNEIHVYYEVDIPWPLGKGTYTNGHIISSPKQNHYQVSWFSISSDVSHDLKGSINFYPWKNGTIIVYKSWVDPKAWLAGALRKLMVKDVEKSLKVTIETIEKLKKDNSLKPKFIKEFSSYITKKPAS